MILELNVYVVVLWGTAVTAFALSVFAWRRRKAGDWAKSFAVLGLVASYWSLTYSFEVASVTFASQLFWAKIEYLGYVTMPVVWFVFALQYTGRDHLLSKARLIALFIIPFLTLLFVFTNQWHGLIWSSLAFAETGTVSKLVNTHGVWFWVHTVYSYLLIVSGTLMLLQVYVRYPKAYRRQNATLVVGALLPLIANAVFVSGLLPITNLDFTPLAFTVSALLIANAIFRYQLFDIVPVARRTAVDNMRDGMIVLDQQNRVIDINPAALALFQQTAVDMIGQNIGSFLQNQTTIVETFRDVSETNTEVAVAVDDKTRYFELHISPLTGSNSGVNGRLVVFYDITSRKEVEKELARARDEALEANLFKTELLARVSHELRTPLNVILGYTEMMQEGIFGELPEKQREPTNKIIESTAFLTRQVNELLELSRLEVREISLTYTEFSIAELLKLVQERMQVLAAPKEVTLMTDIPEQFPGTIIGDPNRIEQILLNLIGNAIKFSDKGVVTQSVCLRDETHWSLTVSDEGIGIPAEMHQTIFEPFKQVDGSLTRMHSGTGLGLAIVRQLADLMDGELFLESEVNEGSSFTVVFPLLTAIEEEVANE